MSDSWSSCITQLKPSTTSGSPLVAERGTDLGQPLLLADRARQRLVLGAVAERARQPATAGVEDRRLDAQPFEQHRGRRGACRSPGRGSAGGRRRARPRGRRRRRAHGRPATAAANPVGREQVLRGAPRQPGQRPGARVVGQQRRQLVAEGGEAATARARRPGSRAPSTARARRAGRSSVRRARSSIPASYRVRPQHAQRDGTATRSPVASSTATRSSATPGRNVSVKVSGQTTTVASAASRRARRRRGRGGTASAAKRGAGRRVVTPATACSAPARARDARARRWAARSSAPPRARPTAAARARPSPAAAALRPVVVVRQELGLVGGDVDPRRAVAQAALAGEAQVERLVDVVVVPGRGRRPRPGTARPAASPGRGSSGARRGSRGTTGTSSRRRRAGTARRRRSARRRPGAPRRPRRRSASSPAIRTRTRWSGPVAQVGVERVGVDALARVHPAARIEGGLEPPERVDQLRPVHPLEQLAARLAVAVLAGQRAAERHDEVGGALDERAIGAQALRRARSRTSLRVCAQPCPKCPYSAPRVAELGPQRGQRPQVARRARSGATAASSQPS